MHVNSHHKPDSHTSTLQHTPFKKFLCARVFSSIAFQMQAVAVGWQIYALTGSAWYLGLVGLAQFLPMFMLTLVVGHVADRYDRRMVVRVCQTVEDYAPPCWRWAVSAAGNARKAFWPRYSS
jgi:MFS family permease